MGNSNSNVGSVLIALAAGALAGAAVGVLYAPDKGEKTRKKIAKSAKKLSKSAKRHVEDIRDAAEERVNDTTASVKETAAKVSNGVK